MEGAATVGVGPSFGIGRGLSLPMPLPTSGTGFPGASVPPLPLGRSGFFLFSMACLMGIVLKMEDGSEGMDSFMASITLSDEGSRC